MGDHKKIILDLCAFAILINIAVFTAPRSHHSNIFVFVSALGCVGVGILYRLYSSIFYEEESEQGKSWEWVIVCGFRNQFLIGRLSRRFPFVVCSDDGEFEIQLSKFVEDVFGGEVDFTFNEIYRDAENRQKFIQLKLGPSLSPMIAVSEHSWQWVRVGDELNSSKKLHPQTKGFLERLRLSEQQAYAESFLSQGGKLANIVVPPAWSKNRLN